MVKANANIRSEEAFDDVGGNDIEDRVLDMMATGQSSSSALRNMETISAREFDYETITERHRNVDTGVVTEVDNPGRSLAYEAFMQEPVVIMINESTDDKAPPVVYVSDNRDERWLPRGVPIRLQRKFVEIIAQSNERTYKTMKINASEDNDNERPSKMKRTQGTPFSVIKDSNQDARLSRRWLMRVTRQGL